MHRLRKLPDWKKRDDGDTSAWQSRTPRPPLPPKECPGDKMVQSFFWLKGAPLTLMDSIGWTLSSQILISSCSRVFGLSLQNTIVQREIIDFSGGKGDNWIATSLLDCPSAEEYPDSIFLRNLVLKTRALRKGRPKHEKGRTQYQIASSAG